MSRLEIGLLGAFQVTLDSKPVERFESDKARALLAYLSVETDRPHRREALAGLFWSDTAERTARTNLRSALANLQKIIGSRQAESPFLLVTRQTIQFSRESNASVDVSNFLDAVNKHNRAANLAALHEAAALYQGEFLAGFHTKNVPLFEEWVLITRESLQRQALNALQILAAYHQESENYEQALEFAQRQVELEPYQESAHQQLLWLLALNGQRNAALAHYEAFKTLLETELDVPPLEETQEMHALLLRGDLPEAPKTTIILRREPRQVKECPYRGLAAFQEADAPFFFGREDLVKEIRETIRGASALKALIGSSGSGKSSAVFAGLLPRLGREAGWQTATMRPGAEPLNALAAALKTEISDEGEFVLPKLPSSATRFLLVIDQFEELYTLCSDAVLRHRFLDTLLDAVKSGELPITLLLIMRADFMGQALAYRPFADMLNQNTLVLGPMNRDELKLVVENPAEIQGATFEAGLVTRILDDVGEEPGNLPLLEFSLTLLWERLDQGWMTHAAYEEIGQVGGALARYAEDVYSQLGEEEKEAARQIFVQLVQPGRGTEDTRRVGVRTEFGEAGWRLIQYLAGKRLVVTNKPKDGSETVEIVHEALIREWHRLSEWMDAAREFRIWQEGLRTALQQWESSEQDEGALLHGISLSKAERWLNERSADLSQTECWFIQASITKEREAQKAEIIRQEREEGLERRSQIFLQVMVVVLLLATGISLGFAFFARNEARQAIEASSLSIAANARQALNEGETTSALALALAANGIDDPPADAQRILLDAAFAPGARKVYRIEEIFPNIEGPPTSLAISPDGERALTGFFDGSLILWDIQTGEEISRFAGHPAGTYDQERIVLYSGVNAIAFNPNGNMALSGGDDGSLILWDVESGAEIRRFEGHSGAIQTLAFSPDGLSAISGGISGKDRIAPGELILWDLKSGQEIRRFDGHQEAIVAAGFSPAGHKILASSGEVAYSNTVLSQNYELILWDAKTGEALHHYDGIERDIPDLAISANGDFALTASTDHTLTLWDLESNEKLGILEGHADLVRKNSISPDNRRAISAGGDGEIILWNLEKGEIIARFHLHTAGINDTAISPDGRTALSAGIDGQIILWDLVNAAQLNRFAGHETAVLDVGYAPDGKRFVSASGLFDPAAPIIEEESIRVWGLDTVAQTGTLNWHLGDIFQFDISPDGRRVLSGHLSDAQLRLWDFATGQEIRRIEGLMAPAFSIAFTPDGKEALTGGLDGQIILWNLENGTETRRFTGSEGVVWSLAVSPDGRTALTGADDFLLHWWDLETGEKLHSFVGHEESISGIAFSLDRRRAASADTTGIIFEWDLEKKEEIRHFAAHTGTGNVGRTRVTYSPDASLLLSSGWDGTLALWDVQSGEEIYRFQGHDADFIFDIAISPDGQSALSCGTDQTIIHWQLTIPSEEELFDWITANRRVRELTCEERALYQIEPLCEE